MFVSQLRKHEANAEQNVSLCWKRKTLKKETSVAWNKFHNTLIN